MTEKFRRAWVPCGLLALLIVFSIGNYALGFDAWTLHWWADIAWTLASGAAAWACYRTSRHVADYQRRAWQMFAAGCLAWFGGMLIWDYLELVAKVFTPFPALSDIGFLLMAPLFMVGLLFYRQSVPSATVTLKDISNLGFILCSLVIVVVLILSERIRSNEDGALYVALAVSWSVLYFGLLLFGLYLLLSHDWGRQRRVMLLLVSGIAVHGMVNTVYAHELLTHDYFAGSYLDVFWLLGFALFIWAAAEQRWISAEAPQEPASAGARTRAGLAEAMLPAVAIALIAAVATVYGGDLTPRQIDYLVPAAIGLLAFLLLWEWAKFRVERELSSAVRESGERFRTLVETAESAILLLSPNGDILEFNPAAERLHGVTRAAVLGKNYLQQFLPQERRDAAYAEMMRVLGGEPAVDFENEVIGAGGQRRLMSWYARRVADVGGRTAGIVAVGYDVTEKQLVERQAAERNLRLKRLSELSLMLAGDPKEVFRQVARMIGELLNVPVVCLSEVRADRVYFTAVYAHGTVTLDAGSTPLAGTPCAAEAQTGEISIYQNVAQRFPGNEMLERYRADTYCGFPALDQHGNVVAVTCLLDDKRRDFTAEDLGLLRILGQRIGMEIERQRHMNERAEADAQMRKLSSAIEQTADVVLISDRHGNIEYVNPAFEETTGFMLDEVRGKKSNVVRSGKHDDAFYKKLWETVTRGDVFQDVVINRKKNGELYYEEKTITPLKDASGAITHFISTGKDITERMQIQERLYHLAYHDILTELPNRALFVDRLEHALARQRHGQGCLAVLFMDLDRFKNINDTLGHDIGDRLLQVLSERLRESLRESDTVARLAGDEFVILLEDIDSAADVAPICRKILTALTKPFVINGNELYMTSSIGISLFPTDGIDASTLLRNADVAMYRAKELGRNNFQFYSADMSARAFERLTLETSLRHALERDEFRLHYQPQISLDSGRIIGVEALLRWQHPDFGLVQPGDFIPLLEDTGLIVPAGEWVLRQAMNQAMEWQEAGLNPIRMAINLSSRQFDGRQLLDTIMQLVRETHLDTRWLELEITESLLMNNERLTLEMLQALSDAGIRLSIDDFGTGYSSLGYLKRFPIDTIKIDGSFVRDITTDPDDAAIVTAIIAMATSLKLDVIAEGVESRAQLDFLRHQKCACLQGFLFSRPLPVDEMTTMLQRDNAEQIPWYTSDG